jgi:hypothetical protein
MPRGSASVTIRSGQNLEDTLAERFHDNRKDHHMSLNEDLETRRAISRKHIPQEKLAVMDRAVEDLERSGITASCLKEGDTAPDFVLPNGIGESVSLQDLLTKGPVVLSFYRGGW